MREVDDPEDAGDQRDDDTQRSDDPADRVSCAALAVLEISELVVGRFLEIVEFDVSRLGYLSDGGR
jgi:hypothetical protein